MNDTIINDLESPILASATYVVCRDRTIRTPDAVDADALPAVALEVTAGAVHEDLRSIYASDPHDVFLGDNGRVFLAADLISCVDNRGPFRDALPVRVIAEKITPHLRAVGALTPATPVSGSPGLYGRVVTWSIDTGASPIRTSSADHVLAPSSAGVERDDWNYVARFMSGTLFEDNHVHETVAFGDGTALAWYPHAESHADVMRALGYDPEPVPDSLPEVI